MGILWDTTRHFIAQTVTVYHEIMTSISVCNVLFALAWILSTWAVPVRNEYGDPTGVYGARGVDESCSLQGFLFQFGGLTGTY